MEGKNFYIGIGLLLVILIGGLIYLKGNGNQPRVEVTTVYDNFAQCLTDAGAKFYGAFWCPHCQNQKKTLANSKKIPYIECSTPDGKGLTPVCAALEPKIDGYPTWVFADGSRINQEMSREELSEKTGCALPQT